MTDEERRKLDTLYQKVDTLSRTVNEVHSFLEGLKRQDRIPLTVERAFAYRLKRFFTATLKVSGKSATSENRAVNEAGGAAYSVLRPPDRFILIEAGGEPQHVPAYDL